MTLKLIANAYHVTKQSKSGAILSDSLKPLATNRPKELEVADIAFDVFAEQIGIGHRRRGIFAWPDLETAKRSPWNDRAIFEVSVDSETALVLHQAWIDLAWGMVEGVFARISQSHIERFRGMGAEELFNHMRPVSIREGVFSDVVFELARLYWTTGVSLGDYNRGAGEAMAAKVVEIQKREFPGLMPGLDHEVAIGMDAIPRDSLRLLGACL